jgi:hypothetical protein
VLAAAAVLFAAFTVSNRMSKASTLRASDSKWQSNMRSLEAAQKSASSKANAALAVDKSLDVAFEPAQTISDAISLAGNLTPKGVWLTGVTFERGKAMLVRGTSVQTELVTAYLQSLSAQQRFRDVKLLFATNGLIETTPITTFSISLHVVGNLPAFEKSTKAVRK